MTELHARPTKTCVGLLAGLIDPRPSRARLGTAAAAALLVALLTMAGAHPDELGSGFGKLFLVFAIVAGPAVAGLLVLRPWNGLVAWAAMMALLNVARLQWWIGPFQVTQSTLFVVALVAGAAFDRRRLAPSRAAGIIGIGLGATTIASLLASPAIPTGIPIVQHGVIEPVLVALLMVILRPSLRQVAALGGGLVVGLALASLYSIVRIGRVATTIAGLEAVRVQLAHFTFYNVGIYGDVLAMTIPLALAGLVWWRSTGLYRSVAMSLGVVLALLLAGLYLTFSKSAWLGTSFAILLILIARFRRPRQLAALALASAVAGSLIVPWPMLALRIVNVELPASNPYVALVTRLSGGRLSSWNVGSPEGEVSIGERWRATEAAARMVVDHTLVGVGPGRFGDEYAGRYADPAATRALGSPHNLFPEVASELGLPAALFLLVALLGALRRAWRAARAPDPLLRALGAGLGAAVAAFVVVTATFGIDLYRDYRVMNSDVLIAAMLIGACAALVVGINGPPTGSAAAAAPPLTVRAE